jgi:hypothetical protein
MGEDDAGFPHQVDHVVSRITNEVRLASWNAVSRDLLKSYERGLYEHCALHAGDPHWGGMIAER